MESCLFQPGLSHASDHPIPLSQLPQGGSAKHTPQPTTLGGNSVNVSVDLLLDVSCSHLGGTDPLQWGGRLHTQEGERGREGQQGVFQ